MEKSEIKKMRKKHPRFVRSNYGRSKRWRVKDNWRRPRGVDSKKREKLKTFGAEPNIGHRNVREIRGLHPSGYEEVRVFNPKQLGGVEKEHQAVRIASSVGSRKRAEIIAKADELRIKVLNR